MARPIGTLASHHHLSFLSLSTTTTTLLLLLAAIAAVSSIVFSLCTTHKYSKQKKKSHHLPISPPSTNNIDRKLVSTLSGIGSKALVAAKMVSWKKGDDDVDHVVWKKSILMGEKCRPLDFSGQIFYDAEGNEVKELPSRVVGGRIVGGGNDNGSSCEEEA